MFRKKRPQFTDEIGTPKRESFLISVFGESTGKAFSIVLEIVQIGVLAVVLVVIIRTFLIQPFSVKGASMEPNYFDNEYLIVNELSYRFREPERGETVVFRYPANPREYFIKRIIGLPSERVLIENGKVKIFNEDFPLGRTIHESYIVDLETRGDKDVTLGLDEYFLLGDNRHASLDSRIFGAISREYIVGLAWFRGWPLNRVGILAIPEYNL